MTIKAMKERKIEMGLSNRELAEMSGVPLGTLQKLFSGKTKAPRRDTVQALTRILGNYEDRKKLPADVSGNRSPSEHCMSKAGPSGKDPVKPAAEYTAPAEAGAAGCLLGENAPVYRTRSYTLRDYLALPEEQRAELIDGVFYNMAAPTTLHQLIVSMIQKSLLDHVLETGGPCLPFAAPVDVVLDKDLDTVVQPDVLVVCDRGKLRDGRIYGAPDLVIEVLSPSTRKKDIGLKLYKYYEAGVREYWTVDPQNRQIAVFDLEHEGAISLYGTEEKAGLKVPVKIWNEACSVDFQRIFSFAEPLFE